MSLSPARTPHLAEETLAKDEVGVGEVGQRLQQDLHHNVHLVRHLHITVESETWN